MLYMYTFILLWRFTVAYRCIAANSKPRETAIAKLNTVCMKKTAHKSMPVINMNTNMNEKRNKYLKCY